MNPEQEQVLADLLPSQSTMTVFQTPPYLSLPSGALVSLDTVVLVRASPEGMTPGQGTFRTLIYTFAIPDYSAVSLATYLLEEYPDSFIPIPNGCLSLLYVETVFSHQLILGLTSGELLPITEGELECIQKYLTPAVVDLSIKEVWDVS